MYTAAQVATVIAYNAQAKIFRVTDKGRVVWDLRKMDVDNLRKLGVSIVYESEFAALKRAVKRELVAQPQQ